MQNFQNIIKQTTLDSRNREKQANCEVNIFIAPLIAAEKIIFPQAGSIVLSMVCVSQVIITQ